MLLRRNTVFSVVELALCAVRAGLNEKKRSAHNAGVFDEDIQTKRSLASLFCLGKLPSLERTGLQQIILFQPSIGVLSAEVHRCRINEHLVLLQLTVKFVFRASLPGRIPLACRLAVS